MSQGGSSHSRFSQMRSACQERISFLNQKTSSSQVTRPIATRKEKRRRAVKGLSARRIHARYYRGTYICTNGLYIKKACRVTATSTSKAYRGRRAECRAIQGDKWNTPPLEGYCRTVLRVRNSPPKNFGLAEFGRKRALSPTKYTATQDSTAVHMCVYQPKGKSNNCQNLQFQLRSNGSTVAPTDSPRARRTSDQV